VSLRDLAAQRGRFDATDEAFDAALAALEALAMRWDVDAEPALLGEPTCSLAVAGMARGARVVLKVPILGEERTTGYRAARAFAGHGGVDVLEGDDATGALLMRRLEGPDLSTLPDDAATDVWIDLFQRMRGAPGGGMPLVDYVVLPRVPIPGVTLGEHASIVARHASLLASAPAPRLMHGDLHHFNVLAHAGAWYAIDPKGLSGDVHFEAAALLRNPFESLLAASDIAGLLGRRIERIARATGLDGGRLRDWGIVQTYGCASSGSAGWRGAMMKVVRGLLQGSTAG
jgi:streptomycin 6-kinase